MFKNNKVVDERLLKKSNELGARMFPVLGIIELVFLITKIAFGLPFMVYVLEICILVGGIVTWLIEELRFGTLFVKEKDDILKELSNKAKSKASMVMFWIVIIGELFYIFLIDKKYYFWVLTYIVSWLPCAFYITISAVSGGILIFGSKKKEKNVKKDLAIRTFFGSIFFGFVTGTGFYIRDGAFYPKGLIAVLLLAAGWGIPFYFMFIGIMNLSEKNANKNIEKVDDKDEK